MEWREFAAVGVGAALGAWMRWGLGLLLDPAFSALPLGTLAANLIGGYLMGVALGAFEHFQELSPAFRLLITTGFLGGLTTFSAFSAETTTLLARHEYAWGLTAIAAHVLGSLSMTALGILTVALLRSWLTAST